MRGDRGSRLSCNHDGVVEVGSGASGGRVFGVAVLACVGCR